jgi:hypothetical protein
MSLHETSFGEIQVSIYTKSRRSPCLFFNKQKLYIIIYDVNVFNKNKELRVRTLRRNIVIC